MCSVLLLSEEESGSCDDLKSILTSSNVLKIKTEVELN